MIPRTLARQSSVDVQLPDDLERLNDAELEDIYAHERPFSVPAGVFYGRHLGWLNTRGGGNPILRPLLHLAFRATPFGIDFESRLWFFNSPIRRPDSRPRLPLVKMGRFESVVGPSRWRDTDTVRLHYERSALPRPIRALLYDEVKPLSEDLCLGIGGTNAARGRGDCFWFALVRG